MTDLAGFDWKAPDYGAVWEERMAKLEALRKEPARWEPLFEFYASHPVEFICDWGVTFDPRNAGTDIPTTMPFLLFPKQQEFILWVRDRWKAREDGVVEKSRDMGISWCCIGFAVWLWRFHEGSVIGFGSRKEDLVDKIGDPDSLFWKARMFIDGLPFELKPKGYDADKHAPFMRILNLEKESAIVGEAGDNIGRGGRASVYIKDESAHYEHPESIDAALSQTSNCSIDVSTPNGEGNPFWQKVHGGRHKIFVFDWKDDPRKDKAWYAVQKNKMTAVALASEVDRDYSASITNSFVTGQLVTDAMLRGPKDVPAQGPLRVSMDVARYGDDSNVLSFRRGRVLLRQSRWNKSGIESTAGRARQEIETFRRLPGISLDQIAVDVIGLGAGVADLLRGWYGEIVVDVNSSLKMTDGKHYNLRAFMWQQMLDWLKTASIPNNQQLRASLTSLRYGYRGGELLLESKEDMKKRGIKSPDEADSLALSFAYPVTKKAPQLPPDSRITRYSVDPETGM